MTDHNDLTSEPPGSDVLDEQIALEQHSIDRIYHRLDQLRSEVERRRDRAINEPIAGTPASVTEREGMFSALTERLSELNSVDERLCFGRLDFDDTTTRYVGRIGLSDKEQNSILMDWRADAASAFYQATAANPLGVVRRRNIATRLREVTGLDDDVLNLEALTEEQKQTVTGTDSLLTALDASRTGRMTDIVATIQAEQDVIIRHPTRGALVVEGGPGTGKTVVALHRVAYLLYAERKRLNRSGVLVVGPNSDFISYIDKVLPALGETGVVMRSLGQLFPGVDTSRVDDPAAAAVKGSAEMVQVIAKAVANRRRVPDGQRSLKVANHTITLRPRDVEIAIGRAVGTRKSYNAARPIFVKDVLHRLAQQYARKLRMEADPDTLSHLTSDLRESPDVRREVNLCWMPQTPQQLVGSLLTNPATLAAAADGLLNEEQQAALLRSDPNAWTISDVPLLDEAAELLGDIELPRVRGGSDPEISAQALQMATDALRASGVPASMISAQDYLARFDSGGAVGSVAERAGSDREWVYGHVVVDEAQELTYLQWRAIIRRCPSKSMTIVGDPAQASSAGSSTTWAQALGPHLDDRWERVTLTVNYRTPELILKPAVQFVRSQGLQVADANCAREGRWHIEVVNAAATVEQLTTALLREATQLHSGLVALVVPPELHAVAVEAAQAFTDSPAHEKHLEAKVFSMNTVKGLEFDAVILVQPDDLIASSLRPVNDLYVAMTRPTQRLILHTSHTLPTALLDALDLNSV